MDQGHEHHHNANRCHSSSVTRSSLNKTGRKAAPVLGLRQCVTTSSDALRALQKARSRFLSLLSMTLNASKRVGPDVERGGWSMCSKNRSSWARRSAPVALVLIARFQQQGVLGKKSASRPFWPSGCTSVSVAQRGQMFSSSRCASGWWPSASWMVPSHPQRGQRQGLSASMATPPGAAGRR